MSEIVNSVKPVWTRLFDHRQFLNGEIQYTLKEFQEKRSDREVEQLFSLLEYSTDLKDTKINRLKTSIDSQFPDIQEKLIKSFEICNSISNIEEEFKENSQLEINNAERKKQWEIFVEDMTYKCQRVDHTFEEKEEELREFYADLEKKLIRH